MMSKEELKNKLIQDGLFRSDGGLNTAWIHNRAQNYDFSELDGGTLQEKIYLLFHERKYCVICGKPNPFRNWSHGYPDTCCRDCKREFDRKTLREKAVPKVQTPEVQARRKQTCIDKYGVDNPFKAEKVKQKIYKTNTEKYGVAHPAQNRDILAKMEQTNKARHGGLWNAQTKEHRENMALNLEKLLSRVENEKNCTRLQTLIDN